MASPPRSRRHRTALLFVGAAAFLYCNCLSSISPPQVPPSILTFGEVDLDASEVALVDAKDPSRQFDASRVAEVRKQIAAILGDSRNSSDASRRIRFRARVTFESYYNAAAQDGCAAVPGLLGIPIDREQLSIDLTLQGQTGMLHGAASAQEEGGAYSNAQRRALKSAIAKAVSNATISSPSVGSQQPP